MTAVVRHPLKLVFHPVRACLLFVGAVAMFVAITSPATEQGLRTGGTGCQQYRDWWHNAHCDARVADTREEPPRCARAREAYELCITPVQGPRFAPCTVGSPEYAASERRRAAGPCSMTWCSQQ